jgi:hypothetical protein
MAGVGKPPKAAEDRRGAHLPQRGDWQAVAGSGWQHGPIPAPPARLRAVSRETWVTWFQAWFAAHWGPEDLPMLRLAIGLYNLVAGGKATAAERSELRQLCDSYGITKKGQQDRRWTPPKEDATSQQPGAPDPGDTESPTTGRYGHLRSVKAAG